MRVSNPDAQRMRHPCPGPLGQSGLPGPASRRASVFAPPPATPDVEFVDMGEQTKPKKKGIIFGLPLRLHHHHHHHHDAASVASGTSQAATAASGPDTPGSVRAGSPEAPRGDEAVEDSPFASAIPHSPGSVTYNKAAVAAENGGVAFPTLQRNASGVGVTPERSAGAAGGATGGAAADGAAGAGPAPLRRSTSSTPGSPLGIDASVSRTVSSARLSRASTPGLDASEGEADDTNSGDDDADSKLASQRLVSVLLCEAAFDTPSFRASVNYIDQQFKELQAWLAGLTARSANHASHMAAIRDSINGVIEHFMPAFTNNSILLQDYTTLLFSTFATSESSFWTDLIAQVQQSNEALQAAISRLYQGVLSRYTKARAAYLTALREHDLHFQAVMRLPADAEPAALRDTAQRSHTLGRALTKAATALVLTIGDVESEASLTLMDTLSAQALGRSAMPHGMSRDRAEVVIDMHRIRSLSARLRAGFPDVSTDLRAARASLLRQTRAAPPPKDLSAYSSDSHGLTPEDTEQTHKFGWVYMLIEQKAADQTQQHTNASSSHHHRKSHDGNSAAKGANGTSSGAASGAKWQQCWAFVQNGFFGALTLDKSGTSVLESVKLATICLDVQEETAQGGRAHTFSLQSDAFSVHVQTETRTERLRWVNALSKSRDQQIAVPHVIVPWSPKFATDEAVDLAANSPDTKIVATRVREVGADTTHAEWLRPDSTLTSEGASIPVQTIPALKPLPTPHMGDALVANWFFRPQGVPNAMTANFWGALNWLNPITEAAYSQGFPVYPENYPRRLIVQDSDMRAVASQLPADHQPASGDLLQFIIRATTVVQKREIPTRLYVTGRTLVIYTSWRGLVSVQGIDLSRIVDIEIHHGVDFSDMRMALQTDSADESHSLAFRLYVDSAALAKRKFSIVIENLRSRHPMNSRDLFEHLALVNIEYADTLRKEETHKQGELGGSGPNGTASHGLAAYLLEKSVGSGTQRGEEDTLQIGKGMQSKVSEDTFPISAEALFLTMFGAKSPVFTGDFTGVVHGTSKAGPWYRRGRFVERKVVQKATVLGSDDSSTQHEMFHYQRIEQKDPEFYVVTERRSAWEMPTGDQFYLVFKYCIYSTEQGSHIQVWNKVVWTKDSRASRSSQDTVLEFAKMGVRTVMLRTRKAASRVSNTKEALHQFGTTRATKILEGKESRQLEQTVTRVSAKSFASVMTQLPLSALWTAVKLLISSTVNFVCTLSSPLLILLSTAFLSLFLNMILYRKSSVAYWSATLEDKEINRVVEAVSLLPERGTVFRRAVYTQDLNDAITDGLWGPDGITSGTGLSLRSNSSQCSSRFGEIAKLSWSDDYDKLSEYEPSVLQTLRRISDVRQYYALKRTEMLSRLRVLNSNEREQLMHEYRKWLVSETTMCSRVRSELAKLDTAVFHEVREYCLSCLEEAKGLL